MWSNVLTGIVIAVIAFIAWVAAKPDAFHIERTTTIKAPPEKVFAVINDFKGWTHWSPWENRDPQLKRTYSGAESGKGAAYAWQGNKDVGEGRMEIIESSPASRILIKLDFLKPFEAHNTAEFTLQPEGEGTRVTWSMDGPQPFMAKLMSLFFSMDTVVGGDFETGLANMKKLAER